MITRARILKAPDAKALDRAGCSLRPRVVRREAMQAREQADQLLAQAQLEAEALLAEAKITAQEQKRIAQQRGFQEGQAAALAQALHFHDAEARRDQRALDRLMTMACALSERLLGTALKLEPQLIANLAQQLLEEARGAQHVVLRANPDDVALLREGVKVARHIHLSVEPDVALARGELRLSSEVGDLDASLGSRLRLLSLALKESLRTAEGQP